MTEIPRRIDRSRHTPAESAITQAMAAVEAAGAHPRLTDAVTLLGKARDAVADYVDGVRATVATPTVGRFVQVNIGDEERPAWRPALVVAVWPDEFSQHPVTPVGLNCQVFFDGMNDTWIRERETAKHYADGLPEVARDAIARECRSGMLWVTSVPHEGAPRAANPAGWWVSGPRWRWPPRD